MFSAIYGENYEKRYCNIHSDVSNGVKCVNKIKNYPKDITCSMNDPRTLFMCTKSVALQDVLLNVFIDFDHYVDIVLLGKMGKR